MCVESRSAVRAHDPQILDSIVIANAVDVVMIKLMRLPRQISVCPQSSQTGCFKPSS
jgi:hypothetical protein